MIARFGCAFYQPQKSPAVVEHVPGYHFKNEQIMNHLSVLSQAIKTMSSREISELTGKEHRNVMADIRAMLDALNLDTADFSAVYLSDNGQRYECFNLRERECLILVSGYNIAMRAKIIDRWQQLEAKAAPAVPQSLSAALRLAADQAEQIETQQAQLAIAVPKAAFVDRYVVSTGLKGFREVCKLLGANESRFREFLTDSKIMYRLGGSMTAYQNHIDAGRFEVRTGVAETEHAFSTTKFTAKGFEWVAGEWAKHQLREELSA